MLLARCYLSILRSLRRKSWDNLVMAIGVTVLISYLLHMDEYTYVASILIPWWFTTTIPYHDVLLLLYHAIILIWCPVFYYCYHDDDLLYTAAADCMDCMLHWLLTKDVMISWIYWLGNCMVLCTPVRTCKGLIDVASM